MVGVARAGARGRTLMWVVPQLLAFAPAARPRLASPMAAFVSTTPISAKLLMLPEAVSAMDSAVTALAVVGQAGTEPAFVAFSFFQAVLLPYMTFASFIGCPDPPPPRPARLN